jgi:iron complex outermembrane recepter protein
MHLRTAARPLRVGRLTRALRVAAAACVVLACAAPLRAQAPPDTARFRLDSLQVPVTRSALAPARAPVALSLIGRADIQGARATIGLDEALASVPGLIVNNRQNFSLGSRVVIRGLGARAAFGVRGVRVLVDGIPLTMPDGQTNLNNLDLGAAGSIHVLRGPASALFGNAAGGVIAVETETAPLTRSADARMLLGDQGRGDAARLFKAQAKVGETVGRFDYLVSASRLEADGYRDHSRARASQLNTRVGYRAGERTRVSLVLNAVDMPEALNPGSLPADSFTATPTMAWPRNVETAAGESTRQIQTGLRIRHDGAVHRADVALYALHRTLENPLPFGFIDLTRRAGGLRALYERTLPFTIPTSLTTGIDIEAQRDRRFEFANDGGSPTGTARRNQIDRVASAGPFAQLHVVAGPAAFTLGTRWDVVRFESDDRRGLTDANSSGERTLDAPSFMAGVTVGTAAGTLFGNVASAFQTPTTTELLNAPPAPGEPCCPAGFNTALEPQRALSTELGLRGSARPGLGYEAVAFLMDVEDALVQFQVPEAEGRDFFRNAGRTRHRGVELSAHYAPVSALTLTAAYTLTDVRFRSDGFDDRDYEGNRVPGIAPHRVHGAATLSRGVHRLAVELQHHARQAADDANSAWNSAFTVVDVRATTGLRTGGLELAPFIALNNIFDVRYSASLTVNAAAGRFFEPAPGFNVHFGTSIRTGSWRGR